MLSLVDGRRHGLRLQLGLGLSSIARAAQTMATNPFRKTVVAQMSRIWETLKANQFSK
jgi:hypothetical protein